MDLRVPLLAAIDDGMSCRAAAVRFGVAASTPIRWQAQWRVTGGLAPKPQGGDMRARGVEERATRKLPRHCGASVRAISSQLESLDDSEIAVNQ